MNGKCVKAVVSIAFGVIFLSASAAEIPLEIRNAGFEEVDKNGCPIGWSRHSEWHGERCGHNGSGALVFERSASVPAPKGRPGQRIDIRPGKRYLISALVKTRDIVTTRKSTGMGMTLHLDVYNSSNKWMFGTMATPFVNGTSGDWVKVQAVTRRIPENVGVAYIQPLAHECISGTGIFDNIHVAVLEQAPVAGVFTDAYRNESAGGEVKFFASLDIDTGAHRLEDCRVSFSYVARGGITNSVKGEVLGSDSAAAVIDTALFAPGTNDVRCSLYVKGKEIGSASVPFVRVSGLKPRKVFIDRNRMTFVDGKPFFPLGMFYSSGAIRESNMNVYTEAPFNVVMPYGFNLSAEQMDLCLSKGVRVIYDLRNGHDDPDAGRKWVEGKVTAFRDHPALLAWYTNDERPVSAIPKLKLRQGWIEALDRDHPTWSVQDVFYETRQYLGTYDVLGMDPYPVPKRPIGMVITSMRQGNEGTFGTKAVWQVPQAFGWGWLKRRETAGQRGPSRKEMANMTWQSIAGGANGIIYYAFHTLKRADAIPGDNFDLAWGRVKAAAFEVKKYENVLISLEKAPSFTVDNDAVAVRAWRHGGSVYLLAVNCTEKPQTASVTLDAVTDGGVDADFGPAPKISGRGMDFTFAPLDYVMLRFRQ